MMTLDETMIINNMTNVIKNLEQSKRICDIIDDLNKLILTLGGRKHDEPEHVKTETKPEQVEHVPEREPVKAVTVTYVHTETKDKTVTMMKERLHSQAYASEPLSPPRPAAGPPSKSKSVQHQWTRRF